MFKDYRKQSRDVQWGLDMPDNKGLTSDQINCGSLLRVADAVEKMAASYDRLREDRDYWKNRAFGAENRLTKEERRTAALRGVIGRMKKAEGR